MQEVLRPVQEISKNLRKVNDKDTTEYFDGLYGTPDDVQVEMNRSTVSVYRRYNDIALQDTRVGLEKYGTWNLGSNSAVEVNVR